MKLGLGIGLHQEDADQWTRRGLRFLNKPSSVRCGVTDGTGDVFRLGAIDDYEGDGQFSLSFHFLCTAQPAAATFMHIGDPASGALVEFAWGSSTPAIFPQIKVWGDGSYTGMKGLTGAATQAGNHHPNMKTGQDGLNKWYCAQVRWDKTANSGAREYRIATNVNSDTDYDTTVDAVGNWRHGSTDTNNISALTNKDAAIGGYYSGALGSLISSEPMKFANIGIWNRKLTDHECNLLASGIEASEIQSASLKHYWSLNGTLNDAGTASSRDDMDATAVGDAATNSVVL